MRMNIGIGSFYCFQKRNPQPATFFENHFFNVGGVGEGMEKAGSLLGGPAFGVLSGILFNYYRGILFDYYLQGGIHIILLQTFSY